jgi:Glycosyltransferase family 28 C-terminal domain.
LPDFTEFYEDNKKPVVLVSPLDWGLGHTVRCIPIIRELLAQQCTVIIACNSVQKALLIREFPHCTYVHLPGYDVGYGATRWGTIGKIVWQLPKIINRVREEQHWLQQFCREQTIDAIISDNRFGFYHRSIPSVFISHQFHINTGLGRLADALAQRLNYWCMNHFSACWVPDYKVNQSMAGLLSNPRKLPAVPVTYLGGISRFTPCAAASGSQLLVLLSGPEPQRTIFENIILKELEALPAKAVLVRGLPAGDTITVTNPHLTVYNHATASRLNQLICASEMVICRPGYTTVMDLLKLGKKTIMVPTPGQTEQEYLAKHLHRQGWAYAVKQHAFSLSGAMEAARGFTYQLPVLNMEEYKATVRHFVHDIISTSDNQKTRTAWGHP